MSIPLAPQGRREIWIVGAISVAVMVGGAVVPLYPLIPLAGLVFGFAVFFFRDPERVAPYGEGLVIAPADGTVTDITEVEDAEFIDGPATRVGIFMSVLDVHVNRCPCSGRVVYMRYAPGEFGNAMDADAIDKNEANLVGLETPEGVKLLVRQVAGLIARRIVCTARQGDELARGERFGMIKFGSRLEVYIPAGVVFEPSVEPGDRALAGTSVLGVMR